MIGAGEAENGQIAPPREAPQARPFHRRRRFLRVLNLSIALAFLGWLLWGGGSVLLKEWLTGRIPAGPAFTLAYTLVAILLLEGITFPLRYAEGHSLKRHYGLSTQTRAGFLRDHTKALALGVLFAVAAVQILYALLAHFPATWWIWMGAIASGTSLLLTQILPVLLVPIFFRLYPIRNPKLSALLAELARRADTPIKGMYEIELGVKTQQVNAALMGIGPTRRIVLSDTLLRQLTEEEVAIIMAHELAHHRLGHIGRLLLTQAAMVFGISFLCHILVRVWLPSFGYQGMDDLAALPLFALIVLLVGFALLPLNNYQSRRFEYAADRFALELTGDVHSFSTGMRKLAQRNLAEVSPPRVLESLFHSHPSIEKRVRAAQELQNAQEEEAGDRPPLRNLP